MRTDERSLHTSATPEAVWRVWSDTSTWGEWNPDVIAVTLDGPFTSGTTGTMKNKSAAHSIQLTGVEPGRAFNLETTPIPLTRFVFQCRIAPAADGTSTISQGLTMQGPLAPVFSRMMGSRIADTFPALLRGLAAKAEAAQAQV
jgi:hypothetical protein